VRDLLQERLPSLPSEILDERFRISSSMTGRAVSDRARLLQASPSGLQTLLSHDAFVANLVDMVMGALMSPVTSLKLARNR
jgi:hypothetical protein